MAKNGVASRQNLMWRFAKYVVRFHIKIICFCIGVTEHTGWPWWIFFPARVNDTVSFGGRASRFPWSNRASDFEFAGDSFVSEHIINSSTFWPPTGFRSVSSGFLQAQRLLFYWSAALHEGFPDLAFAGIQSGAGTGFRGNVTTNALGMGPSSCGAFSWRVVLILKFHFGVGIHARMPNNSENSDNADRNGKVDRRLLLIRLLLICLSFYLLPSSVNSIYLYSFCNKPTLIKCIE